MKEDLLDFNLDLLRHGFSLFRECDRENAAFADGTDIVLLDAGRQVESSLEPAEVALDAILIII